MKYITIRPFDYFEQHFAAGSDVPASLVTSVPVIRAMARQPHMIFTIDEGETLPKHIQDIVDAHSVIEKAPKKTPLESKASHPSNGKKAEEEAPVEKLAFDPNVKTVKEVLEFIKHNPAQKAAVIKAEKAGKNRAQIVGESEDVKAAKGTLES